jgi:hypothetical protein
MGRCQREVVGDDEGSMNVAVESMALISAIFSSKEPTHCHIICCISGE